MPIITINGVDYPLPDDDGTASKVPAYNETIQAILARVFGSLPWARVTHSTTQTLSNNTDTALAFNTDIADTDTIHDTSTNNERLTCKTAGVYAITTNVGFASNATGVRALTIYKNGTDIIGALQVQAVNGSPTRLALTTVIALAVNDYVEAHVNQTSGGNLNTEQGNYYSPLFMMGRLGA